jgi:hypothetical protein
MSELVERIERIEGDMYRIDPEKPGMAMRMDRLERIMRLAATVTLGGGGLAIAWQLLQLVTALALKGATP